MSEAPLTSEDIFLQYCQAKPDKATEFINDYIFYHVIVLCYHRTWVEFLKAVYEGLKINKAVMIKIQKVKKLIFNSGSQLKNAINGRIKIYIWYY